MKIKLLVAAISFSLLSVTFTNVEAAEVTTGDLVKAPEFSAVYRIESDGKRHPFPTSGIYFSWYDNFSSVKTIPLSQLQTYSLGKNVTFKTGTVFKIPSVPKVYEVLDDSGRVKWIETEEAFYAKGYTFSMVKDLPEIFWQDYSEEQTISSDVTDNQENQQPTGNTPGTNTPTPDTTSKDEVTQDTIELEVLKNTNHPDQNVISENSKLASFIFNVSNDTFSTGVHIEELSFTFADSRGSINYVDEVRLVYDNSVVASKTLSGANLDSITFSLSSPINVKGSGNTMELFFDPQKVYENRSITTTLKSSSLKLSNVNSVNVSTTDVVGQKTTVYRSLAVTEVTVNDVTQTSAGLTPWCNQNCQIRSIDYGTNQNTLSDKLSFDSDSVNSGSEIVLENLNFCQGDPVVQNYYYRLNVIHPASGEQATYDGSLTYNCN